MANSRKVNFIIFFTLLLTEVLIALFINDSIIRPYIGDVLVVMVIYFLCKSIFTREIKLLPLYIFLFAVMVEICQYLNIVDLLGLQDNRFMRILIGSTFDIKDIICYFVGTLLLFVLEYVLRRNSK